MIRPDPARPLHRNTRISRADLLRFMEKHGLDALRDASPVFGFYPGKTEPDSGPVIYSTGVKAEQQAKVEYVFQKPGKRPGFWAVVEQTAKKESAGGTDEPEWTKGKGFEPDEVTAGGDAGKRIDQPLVAHSRIWPLLKALLGIRADSREPDMVKTIRRISRLEPLDQLPRKPRLAWRPNAFLLIDSAFHLLPFRRDQRRLLDWIADNRGRSGLDVIFLDNGPEREGLRPVGMHLRRTQWQFPEPHASFLIMSDLGCLDSSGGSLNTWLRLGVRFRCRGLKPVVLTPCPPDMWDQRLLAFYTLIWWDRGVRFPRPDHWNRFQTSTRPGGRKNRSQDISALLSLLSVAIRIEPELLRAVRMGLPRKAFDAGVEAAAWNHPDVIRTHTGCFIKPGRMDDYLKRFLDNSIQRQARAIDLRDQCHAHLSPAVIHEEALITAALTGEKLPAPSVEFMRKFYRTVDDNPSRARAEKSWFDRLTQRLSGLVFNANSKVLTPVWLKIYGKEWMDQKKDLPVGCDPNDAPWLLSRKKEPYDIRIYQQERELICFHAGSERIPIDYKGFLCGVYIGRLKADRYLAVAGRRLNPEQPEIIQLPENGPLEIESDLGQLRLDRVEKPEPAQGMGRDQNGLFIILSGHDERENRIYYDWGDVRTDTLGIYTAYTIKGIEFMLRWIPPGTFMMGSPENEPERDSDEIQHEVSLTRGFWLADTACPQSLWVAVMGENPSNFKGDNRPVEQISWEDTQVFLEKLNDLLPGGGFRLPTEAEWEYACRAGTTTPFSFGNTITPDQVNYDGGRKGTNRKETVRVKSLPPNGWGLYEMHGNVWEWCADWSGDYDLNHTLNPLGPETGENRVLRGGSWANLAWFCRSASRGGYGPVYRNGFIGFRLARGHQVRQADLRVFSGSGPAAERAGRDRKMRGDSKDPAGIK